MKICMNCNTEVGGQMDTCPLCQNLLSGEGSEYNWPPMEKLKKQAFLYKLQLFIVLAISAISLGLDFLFDLNNGKHWSLIITITIITIELVIRGFLRKSVVPAKIVSISAFYIALLLLLTGWYYGFVGVIIYYVIPIFLSAVIIADLILSLADKSGNALVYLLVNILFALVAYVSLVISKYKRTLPWKICLMIGVVSLIGIIVFKGRKVTKELEKRMNF